MRQLMLALWLTAALVACGHRTACAAGATPGGAAGAVPAITELETTGAHQAGGQRQHPCGTLYSTISAAEKAYNAAGGPSRFDGKNFVAGYPSDANPAQGFVVIVRGKWQ